MGLHDRGGWADTTVDLPAVTDLLTDRAVAGTVRVAELLDRYPVALLIPA